MKNIQTHEAKIDLIKKFLDYANITDASYAMLHYIHENAEKDEKADHLTFGDTELVGVKLQVLKTVESSNMSNCFIME